MDQNARCEKISGIRASIVNYLARGLRNKRKGCSKQIDKEGTSNLQGKERSKLWLSSGWTVKCGSSQAMWVFHSHL